MPPFYSLLLKVNKEMEKVNKRKDYYTLKRLRFDYFEIVKPPKTSKDVKTKKCPVSEEQTQNTAREATPRDATNTVTEKCSEKISDRLKLIFPCTFYSGKRLSRDIGLLGKLRVLSVSITHRNPR